MPPRKRTTAAQPAGPPESTAPATGTTESTAPATTPSEAGTPAREPNELRLHLPFLTLTLTRPAPREHHPRPAGGKKPATPAPDPQSGQRLLFYTGVAALGVAGVVEWPVAAAIAAGTWLASHARPGGQQPSTRPALPAGGGSSGTP